MVEEKQLVDSAKKYLKEHYGEDTVSMTVTKNNVVNGNGDLQVNCTVKYMGSQSDWSKVFSFHESKISYMSARPR